MNFTPHPIRFGAGIYFGAAKVSLIFSFSILLDLKSSQFVPLLTLKKSALASFIASLLPSFTLSELLGMVLLGFFCFVGGHLGAARGIFGLDFSTLSVAVAVVVRGKPKRFSVWDSLKS